jgi:hypothetical protein
MSLIVVSWPWLVVVLVCMIVGGTFARPEQRYVVSCYQIPMKRFRFHRGQSVRDSTKLVIVEVPDSMQDWLSET